MMITDTWATAPDYLAHLSALVADSGAVARAQQAPRRAADSRMVFRADTAVIPVTGILTPRESLITQLLSLFIDITTLESLHRDIAQALAEPGVGRILLAIDSPGGHYAGISELAERIYQARGRKPIVSYVQSLAASGAYWIASSTEEVLIGPSASLGSLGVAAAVDARTDPARVEIVSSQTPRKRPDVRTAEGRGQLQAHVDQLAEVFLQAVARNRAVSMEALATQFGQGGLVVGQHAITAGMADTLVMLGLDEALTHHRGSGEEDLEAYAKRVALGEAPPPPVTAAEQELDAYARRVAGVSRPAHDEPADDTVFAQGDELDAYARELAAVFAGRRR